MRAPLTSRRSSAAVDRTARKSRALLPPSSEAELLAHAATLAGRTVAELARIAEQPEPPDDQRHAKGLVGRLLELVLGANSGNAAQPDFAELGIELKTIPLDRHARPLESTFVCTVPLARMAELEWERSPVHAKLRRVLWIPLESSRDLPLGARRIGTPRLWSPSTAEDAALRADYEQLASALAHGEAEQLRAHVGRYLQVRPKGANRLARVRGSDVDGAPLSLPPRGFYLRTVFTSRLFSVLSGDGDRLA